MSVYAVPELREARHKLKKLLFNIDIWNIYETLWNNIRHRSGIALTRIPGRKLRLAGRSWYFGSAFGGAKFMRLVHDSPAVPSVILLSNLSAHDENSKLRLISLLCMLFQSTTQKLVKHGEPPQTTNTNLIPRRNSIIIHMNDNNDAGHRLQFVVPHIQQLSLLRSYHSQRTHSWKPHACTKT